MLHTILKIHPKDNVLVALTDLRAGERVVYQGNEMILTRDVPAKHKFAEEELHKDQEIFMYGIVVAKALYEIAKGEVLTTQNIAHKTAEYTGKRQDFHWQAPNVDKWRHRTFQGYHRPDGQVGTANHWIVVPLVFCENRNVEIMKQAFVEELGFENTNPYKNYVREMKALYAQGQEEDIQTLSIETAEQHHTHKTFKNVDGIKFLTHQGGCGGTRQDSEALCALIAGYINNPNVAGATVLSLGCQNAQPAILREKLNNINPDLQKPVIMLEQQKEGTEQALLTSAIQQTFLALTEA